MRRISSFIACALLSLGAASVRAEVQEIAFSADDKAQLAKGEVVVLRRDPKDGKGVGAQAAGIVDATPEEVWQVVNDCPHFKDFMPRTKTSEEKLREPGHSVCRVEIAIPFPMSNLWSETDVTEAKLEAGGYRRSWKLLKGTYKKLHGAWDVLPEGKDKTLLVYRLEAEPDTMMPDAILRAGQTSSLPDMLKAVRARVAGKRAEKAK